MLIWLTVATMVRVRNWMQGWRLYNNGWTKSKYPGLLESADVDAMKNVSLDNVASLVGSSMQPHASKEGTSSPLPWCLDRVGVVSVEDHSWHARVTNVDKIPLVNMQSAASHTSLFVNLSTSTAAIFQSKMYHHIIITSENTTSISSWCCSWHTGMYYSAVVTS